MEENKGSVVDSFLNQVNGEDQSLAKEQNPFANVTVEQKEVPVEETKEETPVAYHEDPKLRRYIEKEIAKATANLTPREETKFREDIKEDGFIKAFETIIGNDTPEKVNALRMLKDEVEGIRQEAHSVREELRAERQADLDAERELAQGFENIEETFNVDFTQNKKLRSDFVEFIERVAPKDEQGEVIEYPDFEETFKLFQEINKKPQNVRNKELASRGTQRSSDASTAQMPADTSWRGVDKFFSTLKG
jgi:hypothetical protein